MTPNPEPGTSQPSHSKGEMVSDVRFHTIIDDILHNQGYVYFLKYLLI